MNIPDQAAEAKCAHMFQRRPWWWLHGKSWNRWECESCSFQTRTYDAADRMATRPVHPHMSVAFPGYNTRGKK